MQTENNYHNNFRGMLIQALKADDINIADRLLTHLLPFLSDNDQDDVRVSVFADVMTKGSVAMKQLFIGHLGLTPEAAYEYIKNCIDDPIKERSLLPETAAAVGQFYGDLQVGAVIKGDVEIASLLLDHKPDRAIVITRSDGNVFLDNEKCWFRCENMRPVSGFELKQLFNILDRSGLRDVFDSEQPMIRSTNFKEAKKSSRSKCFSGDIPMLSEGVIQNPELFISFLEQMKTDSFGQVYSKVPCWVKVQEHENASGVIIFRRDQYLFSGVKKVNLEGDVSESVFSGLTSTRVAGKLRLNCRDDKALIGNTADIAEVLVKEIMPFSVTTGLRFPAGYTLAIVDVEYLSQFNISPPKLENMGLARTYAEAFFPATVLFNAYSREIWSMNEGAIGIDTDDGSDLFKALSDESLIEPLLKLIPKGMWKDLFKSCSGSLKASELLKAKELFSFDNLDGNLNLDISSVLQLHAAGYMFQEAGANCSLRAKENDGIENPHGYVKFIQMGGWPSSLERPTSVAEGLTLAVRKRNDPIYSFFLQAQGAEETVKAASTPAQYKFAFELFTSEDIRPLLKLVPRNLRGEYLEDEMGI